MKTIIMSLVLFLAVFSYIQALPESLHPYPNNYDQTEIFIEKGALYLEAKFSSDTFTEPNQDFIILMDAQNQVIGKYSGKALSNLSLLVLGDTIKVRLVSDQQNTGYGYSLLHIRTIYSEEYFQPCSVDYTKTNSLYNTDLKQELYNQVKDHTSLGYYNARVRMFSQIDNKNGYVRCVYTGRLVETSGIPDPNNMNTEHTWPKSMGAVNEPAVSDLNHLFPTDNYTNAKRDNYPFGTVYYVIWTKDGSTLGEDYSGRTIFEPRQDHRGNVARAMFYFSIRYQLEIPDYEENVLRTWHTQDPVDNTEQTRNNDISSYQRTRNPFIDHPEYVSQISNF